MAGELGDISFYKSKDGYMARGKSSVSGDRIRNDAAFERTRENAREFGRASRAGKLLRTALRGLLLTASDRFVTSRLAQEMTRIVKTDWASVRGERRVTGGKIDSLTGFEFNDEGRLTKLFHAPLSAVIDRAAGALAVHVPPFVPEDMLTFPKGATHYRLLAGGTAVDFELETYEVDVVKTDELFIDGEQAASVSLVATIAPGSKHPLFLAFGIEFVQEVSGKFYSLNNGMFNCLALVRVEGL